MSPLSTYLVNPEHGPIVDLKDRRRRLGGEKICFRLVLCAHDSNQDQDHTPQVNRAEKCHKNGFRTSLLHNKMPENGKRCVLAQRKCVGSTE